MDENHAPSKENLKTILRYKRFFESDQPKYSNVSQSFDPYHYSDEVRYFIRALYNESIVISFDWTHWTDEAEKYFQSPKMIQFADLDTIRKLFTTIVRSDRFSSGTIATMIDKRVFVMLLQRLDLLVKEM